MMHALLLAITFAASLQCLDGRTSTLVRSKRFDIKGFYNAVVNAAWQCFQHWRGPRHEVDALVESIRKSSLDSLHRSIEQGRLVLRECSSDSDSSAAAKFVRQIGGRGRGGRQRCVFRRCEQAASVLYKRLRHR